jgi:hypothetical protein
MLGTTGGPNASLLALVVPDSIREHLRTVGPYHEAPAVQADLAKIMELEWRRCEIDCLYFLEHYWWILDDKNAMEIRFPILPHQREIIQKMALNKNLIIPKARQLGVSTSVAAVSGWTLFFMNHFGTLLFSKSEDDAKNLLAMAKFGLERLPRWMLNRGPESTSENQKEATRSNGSRIRSLPSKENAGRSRAAGRVVLDEFDFMENPAEAFASSKAVWEGGGSCVIISTGNEPDGEFERLVGLATRGESTFECLFYPWFVMPHRTQEWFDQQCIEMLPSDRAREYPATLAEVFYGASSYVFDHETLSPLKAAAYEGQRFATQLMPIKLIPSDKGPLTIWQAPIKGRSYDISVDCADGPGDSPCAHVYRDDGWHVATIHAPLQSDAYAEVLYATAVHYNNARLAIEMTGGYGNAVSLWLRNHLKYYNFFYRWEEDGERSTPTAKLGVSTNVKTKSMMIQALSARLLRGQIVSFDPDFWDEMFRYAWKGKRMEGKPDDRVMAGAIYALVAEHPGLFSARTTPGPIDINEVDQSTIRFPFPNTGEGWKQMMKDRKIYV